MLKQNITLDRYVLLGNHRDAWTYGALDPSSGTASMIEVVRALGKIKADKGTPLIVTYEIQCYLWL